MKPQELRIGNWIVGGSSEIVRILSINDFEIGYTEVLLEGIETREFLSYIISDCAPINLTKKIMIECGFVLNQNCGYFILEPFYATINVDESVHIGLKEPKSGLGLPKIKTLHQLQNIFYGLTEKELKWFDPDFLWNDLIRQI
jgi:hypothetical protein